MCSWPVGPGNCQIPKYLLDLQDDDANAASSDEAADSGAEAVTAAVTGKHARTESDADEDDIDEDDEDDDSGMNSLGRAICWFPCRSAQPVLTSSSVWVARLSGHGHAEQRVALPVSVLPGERTLVTPRVSLVPACEHTAQCVQCLPC